MEAGTLPHDGQGARRSGGSNKALVFMCWTLSQPMAQGGAIEGSGSAAPHSSLHRSGGRGTIEATTTTDVEAEELTSPDYEPYGRIRAHVDVGSPSSSNGGGEERERRGE